MANLVTYAKQKWEDAKTAITAARLNHMEQGISDCATQINTLGDSVSQRARMGAGLVDAMVNANPSSSMPVQLEVKSSIGKYILIASTTFIGLYSSDEKKFIWRINASTVSSDPSMPDGELS